MNFLARCGAALALCAGLASAHAALVGSQLQPLGGNQWRIDFMVTNDGTPALIEGLTVYFDEALYANLSNAAAPAGWDPLVWQPDLGLPAPGAYDALALDAGAALSVAESQGGFSVRFDWLGAGSPDGALPFEIYRLDAAGAIEVLASGATAAIPLPPTLLLSLGALALAVPATRRAGARKEIA